MAGSLHCPRNFATGAWLADYLATYPQTEPKALTRFDPWTALRFTAGRIGGDIERISLNDGPAVSVMTW